MELIVRKASVRWTGGSKGGVRMLTLRLGVLKRARFLLGFPLQNNSLADPAELLAAAHASSFSLALGDELAHPTRATGEILTTATATIARGKNGWIITNIHLDVLARLLKVSQRKFIDATVRAKTNCLVSQVLSVNISMSAKLET